MELSRQLSLNTIYRIAFLALQFLISLIIPALTGPEGFGLFAIIIANANALVTFTSLGIPSGIIYLLSRNERVARPMLRIVLWSTLLQLGLVILVEWICFSIRAQYLVWPGDRFWQMITGLVIFLSIALTEKYFALFGGLKKLSAYNLIAVVFSLITALALGLLHQIKQAVTVEDILVLTAAVSAAQILLMALAFNRSMPVESGGVEEKPDRKTFSQYSFNSYLANTLQFLGNRADLWIILYLLGQRELGLFAFSSRLTQLILIVPLIFSAVILPFVASPGFRSAAFGQLFRLMNTLNILLGITLSVAGYIFLPLVMKGEFAGSLIPLLLLIPGMMFKSVTTLLAAYFAGKGKVNFNLNMSALCFLLVVLADLLMVPLLGNQGAALAFTLVNALCAGLYYHNYLNAEQYNWRKFFVDGSDIQYMKQYLRSALTGIIGLKP